MKLDELRSFWQKAGGGAIAAIKIDNGKHLLPVWEENHNDFCEECQVGGSLLCCDFCCVVVHPRCLNPPIRGIPQAKLWACDQCAEVMWCRYAGIKSPPRVFKKRVASDVDGSMEQCSFRGVTKVGEDQWEARFTPRVGKSQVVGKYATVEEAARAYDIVAKRHLGDSAHTNFSIAELHHEEEHLCEDGSVLRGVCFSSGSWRSSILCGHFIKHLGFYDNKTEAALAYDRAAKYYYGGEAQLNYPTTPPSSESLSSSTQQPTSPPPSPNKTTVSASSPSKQGYYAPISHHIQGNGGSDSNERSKLSAEVLDMRQRRARQMEGIWQPPVLSDSLQVDVNIPQPPANIRSERMWDGEDGELLDEMCVPPVHQEAAMQKLLKHRKDKCAAAAALVSSQSGVGEVVQILAKQEAESCRRFTRTSSNLDVDVKPKSMKKPKLIQMRTTRSTNSGNDSDVVSSPSPVSTLDGKDMSGWTRLDVEKGTEAFMLCGRDIGTARQMLDWPMKKAVKFYYCVWKYTPQYVQWKATRSGLGGSADRCSLSRNTDNLLQIATAGDGEKSNRRFRGPRMRAVTKLNYKV